VRWLSDSEKRDEALSQLQEELDLPTYPRRIECYDNSNIQGTNPVASMVVFIDGQPKTSEYRRFRIKTVEGANDFASMAEILGRRFKRWENSQGEIVEPEVGQALNTTADGQSGNQAIGQSGNSGDDISNGILSLSKDAEAATFYQVPDGPSALRAAESGASYTVRPEPGSPEPGRSGEGREMPDDALSTPPPGPLPAGGEGERSGTSTGRSSPSPWPSPSRERERRFDVALGSARAG
jgi:hypothetical protein